MSQEFNYYRLPVDSETGRRLTDIYEQTGDIKLTQHAAGHATPEMTLKHYVKGRSEHRNTAAPIATAYGLEN